LQPTAVLREQRSEFAGRFSRHIHRRAARPFREVCRGHRQTDAAGGAGQQGVPVFEALAHL
jgi:hypothetical protein